MADEDQGVAPEEAETPPEEQQETEVEQKAREMGWKPQEEWEGDTANWMPAEDFVERNERLKGRGDKILQTENAKLSRDLDELKRTVGDLKQYLSKADQRAYQRAISDLKQKQRQAVEDGDTQAFDQVERQMQDLTRQASESQEAEQAGQGEGQRQEHPDFAAWRAENPWYGDDPVLTTRADEVGQRLAGHGYQGRQLFDAVTQVLKEEHPSKFGKPNGQGRKASAVEGTGTKGHAKTKWDQVDQEGRAAFNRFVKQGVFSDTKEDRERYADDYLNG